MCPNCKRVDEVVEYEITHKKEVKDEGNFGYTVLGFFIPIVGIVLYCVWNKEKPKDAKKALYGAIAKIVFDIVLAIIGVIIYFGIVFMMLGGLYTFY